MAENIVTAGNEQAKYFPYSDKFHLQRHTFWEAGQDSYTLPPNQDPDKFMALNEVEPVLQGSLQRRRGYQLLSSQSPSTPYIRGFSFRSEQLNIRELVYTSNGNVLVINENGSAYISTLFTPALTATYIPRMVLSRSYGYFADGARADYVKWDGTTNTLNVTNWGIDVLSSPASMNGPSPPGTAADVAFGGAAWSNVNNIKVQDGIYATATTTLNETDYLEATNFGFTVSPTTALVTGIKVDVKGFNTNALDGITAFLLKGGIRVGVLKGVVLPTTNGFVTLGGPNDNWGATLFGSDVNGSGFGVALYSVGSNNTTSLDFVQITVYVSGSSIVIGAPSGTGITLLSGRIYTVVFQNSQAGTTSDLYPFSSSTGPLTNQGQPLSGLPVSSDPQVDQKLLLATADGGDETTLFLVAQIPNATTTYTDIMPDTQLLTQPVYQETQADGTLHGVANNKIPPLFNFPTKHKGRIYGTIQNTLYFSKNLVDVTTSTGTITGKWEEAFPSTYQLDLSELAETITGLLSDGETLWIGTEKHIRRLVGDSPANFQAPEIQFNNAGLYNQDTWQVVFAQGQPVGAMWLTPDFKVMGSDFNTFTDVGWPVQDVLNNVNRAATVLPWAMFVSNGPAEYYMLFLPVGGATTPNTCLVYDLDSKTWFTWTPSDSATGGVFLFDVTGAPRWTFATNAGSIYEWLPHILQDRVNNGPVNYTPFIRTSWLDFGDPTLRKALNQIIVGTADTGVTFSLEGAVTKNDFNSPISIVSSASLLTGPLTDLYVPLASSATRYRWYRFSFTATATTNPNFLSFYNVETIPLHRW